MATRGEKKKGLPLIKTFRFFEKGAWGWGGRPDKKETEKIVGWCVVFLLQKGI